MRAELRELYQSVILDHNKRPRNFGEPAGANRSAEGVNPLCGDQLKVYLTVEGDEVTGAGFEGSGCAISVASASLMTEGIKGQKIDTVERLFDGFREMVTTDPTRELPEEQLGKLTVFAGVREFPMRVKCATLAWHAMHQALLDTGDSATTE